MKMFVVVFVMFLSAVSFAEERIFDCSAMKLSPSAALPEELQMSQNPRVLFRQGLQRWSLQIGNLVLNTLDAQGPALSMESSVRSATLVEYSFWVDGSYEYEFVISVETYKAKLFWWGLGERTPVGTFSCEVIEQ